ncbi:MAG: serine/threonine-protein kinase [Pseudomonadota bacterium]
MELILKDRYEVVRKIGKGGMAEIFRALMKGPRGFKKEVCIKRILPKLCKHPGFEAMFLDEARIAATLQHANIVQVFDFDRDGDGNYFIVMEFIDGPSLKAVEVRAWEMKRAFEVGFAAAIAQSVLMALHHAWTKKIEGRRMRVVHRDLSPHNILVSGEGEIKITDFGIAKAVNSAVRTQSGVIKGKAAYMSPEQAAGRKADRRSDLYSLGVMLWEILAGRRLFNSGPDGKGRPMHDERRSVPFLPELRDDVPEAFGMLVDGLLRVDPDERPPGALDALEILEKSGAAPLSPVGVKRVMDELGFGGSGAAETDGTADLKSAGPGEDDASVLTGRGASSTLRQTSALSTVVDERPAAAQRRHAAAGAGLPVIFLAAFALLAAASAVTFSFMKSSGDPAPGPGMAALRGKAITAAAAAAPPREPIGADMKLEAAGEPGAAAAAVPADDRAEEGKERKEKKAHPAGLLSINVRPWAHVVIDRKKAGYTPLRNHELTAGSHTIVISNPKLDKEKIVKVKIEEDKEKVIFLDFTENENPAPSGSPANLLQ